MLLDAESEVESLMEKIKKIGELLEEMERVAAALSADEEASLFYFMFIERAPFPCWLKVLESDGTFSLLHTNDEYSRAFGVKVSHYRRRPDEYVWGEETANHFRKQDLQALDESASVIEETFTNPKSGEEETWRGWKWRITLQNGRMAVAGCLTERVSK